MNEIMIYYKAPPLMNFANELADYSSLFKDTIKYFKIFIEKRGLAQRTCTRADRSQSYSCFNEEEGMTTDVGNIEKVWEGICIQRVP